MRKIPLLITLFFLAGCMQVKQLQHMDELLTLQDMSVDRDAQIKAVEARNKSFDRLLEVVKTDRLKDYPTKKRIISTFGEPVLKNPATENGVAVEQWLYRYATKYFNAEKVYLYFDDKGNLIRGEHIIPSSQTAAKSLTPEEKPNGPNQN